MVGLKQFVTHIKFAYGVALLALTAFPAKSAFAGEWFQYTEAYAGIERTHYITLQPSESGQSTSNLGARQHIYSFANTLYLLGSYAHHNQTVGGSKREDYAVGIQLTWRFERK